MSCVLSPCLHKGVFPARYQQLAIPSEAAGVSAVLETRDGAPYLASLMWGLDAGCTAAHDMQSTMHRDRVSANANSADAAYDVRRLHTLQKPCCESQPHTWRVSASYMMTRVELVMA